MRTSRILSIGAVALAAVVTLSGCASADPLAPETPAPGASSSSEATASTDGSSDTIVVGSQAYYSNEIIAEIYAQALENAGYTVERKFNIGQRDAYIPALENGDVTLFPEYSGNLLQFFEPDTTARTAEDVYAALQTALPSTLKTLAQSTATDQDSYNVTADFAKEHNLTTIADLAGIADLTLGGPAELEQRPYGPTGLKDVYGVDVKFSPTADTTVDELVAGNIQVANVFSADERIKTQNLVTLEDTKGLFLASNVVPIANASVAAELAKVIDPISAKLTPEGLISLNVQSTVDKKSSKDIAAAWLQANDLI